jgi:dipeptidase D
MNPIATLEPSLLWKHFAALSAIPRCSRHEENVLAHLKSLADGWGLKWSQDKVGNLVIRKPATPGHEASPTVVLQGHVDMVCEQNRGTNHDFSCDPIDLVVDNGWVRADGTTLGADNGIGVSAILAVFDDRTLVHGPLEALFTIDEETALTGASALDPSLVTGRTLINLDSEKVGHFTVGCAGGMVTQGEVPVATTRTDAASGWSVFLKGLSGGHSGMQIHQQLGNSVKLGARFVAEFLASQPSGDWQLASLEGGDKHNAIPRELSIVLAGPADGQKALEAFAAQARAIYAAELGPEGAKLTFEVTKGPVPAKVLTPASQQTVLDLVAALPDGVQGMSKLVPGLVETSCNLASIRLSDNVVQLLTSQRSSRQTVRNEVGRRIEAVIRLAGGQAVHGSHYPAWAPAEVSPLRDKALALWRSMSAEEPVVELIHAGLECGVIGDKVGGGMDMISFGPNIRGEHTPEEKVEIASVAVFYALVTGLLKDLV